MAGSDQRSRLTTSIDLMVSRQFSHGDNSKEIDEEYNNKPDRNSHRGHGSPGSVMRNESSMLTEFSDRIAIREGNFER